jgi:hypothetical protein
MVIKQQVKQNYTTFGTILNIIFSKREFGLYSTGFDDVARRRFGSDNANIQVYRRS